MLSAGGNVGNDFVGEEVDNLDEAGAIANPELVRPIDDDQAVWSRAAG